MHCLACVTSIRAFCRTYQSETTKITWTAILLLLHPATCCCCCCSQALPLIEFRSESAPTSLTFASDGSQCFVGYSDGHLTAFELPIHKAGSGTAAAAGSSVGVIRWSVARHACDIIRLVLHPTQPLLMAASR